MKRFDEEAAGWWVTKGCKSPCGSGSETMKFFANKLESDAKFRRELLRLKSEEPNQQNNSKTAPDDSTRAINICS